MSDGNTTLTALVAAVAGAGLAAAATTISNLKDMKATWNHSGKVPYIQWAENVFTVGTVAPGVPNDDLKRLPTISSVITWLTAALATLLLFLLPLARAQAACTSLPVILQPGTTASANDVMADLNYLITCVNSSIQTTGIQGPNTSAVGDALAWADTIGKTVSDLGVPPGISVNSTAALRALAPGVATAVIRYGYFAANDTKPVAYLWQASCPGPFDNRALYIQPNAGGVGCWAASSPGILNDPREWGAKGDGTTDDTAAIQALFNLIGTIGSNDISFSPGNFKISAALTLSATAQNGRLSIKGVAKGGSIITQTAAADGIDITLNAPQADLCYTNAIRIGDLDLVTLQAGTSDGIKITQSAVCSGHGSGGYAPASFIENVDFHGDYVSTFWRRALNTTNLSNLNVIGGSVEGSNATSRLGAGFNFAGDVPNTLYAVAFNVIGTVFTNLQRGIHYNDYVQGVTVSNVNMTNMGDDDASNTLGSCGILVKGLGTMSELIVTGSQFGIFTASSHSSGVNGAICLEQDIADTMISNNAFIVVDPSVNDILVGAFSVSNGLVITSNDFAHNNATSGLFDSSTAGCALVNDNHIHGNGFIVGIGAATACVEIGERNQVDLVTNAKLLGNTPASTHVFLPAVLDFRQMGGVCNDVADDSALLTAATAVVGINQLGIYATCKLSNSVTMTKPLYIAPNGALDVIGGKTLTLAGLNNDAATPFPGAGTIAGVGPKATAYMPTSGGGTGGYVCRDAANGALYVKATCP